MKFFIPGLSTASETEAVAEFLRHKAQEITGEFPQRYVYTLLYQRMNRFYTMKINYPDPLRGEIVMAICASTLYYTVFTLNRGIRGGIPLLIQNHEVRAVEEFCDKR